MAQPTQPNTPPVKTKPNGASSASVQIRMMIILSIFFFGGVAILTFIPEESPYRGAVMGIFSPLMIFCLYKFSKV